jgi:molybdate transport system substrate-binding protein
MRNFKRIILLPMFIVLLLLSAACGQAGAEPAAAQESVATQEPAAVQETEATQEQTGASEPAELTISAAASLTDAMEEIKTAYTQDRANVSITYNFDSSGSLQQQIEQGADVDVFVSAAVKQMNALKDKGLIVEDTRKDFLENKIVLIVPGDSTAVTGFEDLSTDKVKQVGLGELKSVPAGQYAEEVLTSLGLIDSVKPKAIYGKNVKEVLTWVETGNADAGIVYETDAKISDKVKVAARAPEGSHSPVYYPAAVIKATKNEEAARDFINFLYSGEAKPIFEKYGFVFLAG